MIRLPKRKWTEEDDTFLVEHSYDMDAIELSKSLNRTKYSIDARCHLLGVHLYFGITPYKQEMILSNTHLSFQVIADELQISKSGVQSTIKKFLDRKERRVLFMSDLKPILKNHQYRRVIELSLGRRLLNGETIHHIDMDNTNNDIDNLHLFNNNSKHLLCHGTLNKIVKQLLKEKIIEFISGEYRVVTK